jgi:hypothetical protein
MGNKWTYTYLTADGKVSVVKTEIDKIIVTPNGTNASYADIYDGESTSDPFVVRLRVPTTESVCFELGPDFVLERGLFVDFETNLSSVTVKWRPVK